MDVNKAIIVGRLTRDPELRTTPNGATVTSFSLATNFVYKNKDGQKTEQVEYHNIVTWRKLAEIVAQYCKKGKRVLVEGRLQTRSWDANDGTKKQRTEIVADNVIFLDSARTSADSTPQSSQTQDETPEIQQEAPTAPSSHVDNSKPKNDEISVEDIPF